MAGTRSELAALTAATAFDWDAYHANFDAGMVRLAAALNDLREAEDALTRATRECARDLGLIGEALL